MYFGGYYKQVSREPDNVWRMLKQMRNYFSKTRGGKGKTVQEGVGCTDSKAWQLGTGSSLESRPF